MLAKMKSLTAALHGNSLGAAEEIIEQRGFTPAQIITDGKEGVYCEGVNRKHCCTGYSTLDFPDAVNMSDTIVYSTYFELFVDRQCGTSTSGQVVQPPDSIIVAGMYIHALPITHLYAKGYLGWWVYTKSLYDSIKNHKFVRDRLVQPRDPASNQTDADQGIRIPAPGQRRTASVPLTDSSTSVSTNSSDLEGTADELKRLSLTRSSSTAAGAADWTCRSCKHVHTGANQVQWQCVNCRTWKVDDFEQFKHVPQRGRALASKELTSS